MPVAAANGFLEVLRALPLLEPEKLEEIEFQLVPCCADLQELGRELVQRGWLTNYQVTQLAWGRGAELFLDQYLIIDQLGQGGMGTVFQARHRTLNRVVALKVIRRDCLQSAEAVGRFRREAQAAALLNHPNIVYVYDANQINGIHFLAMEYLKGTDLARLLRREGPLPPHRACDYARQAALGLQHAHERGLVHRDIKPSNLMLVPGGGGSGADVVKILDLGLARLTLSRLEDLEAGPLTATGVVMGTPDYLAPEQAIDARQVDIRTDIYSLGCTLYHMLTGRAPYAGEPRTEKLLKHQQDSATPVEQLCPGMPAGLPEVVRRMMALRPEARQQTPAEVAADLERFARPAGDSSLGPEADPKQAKPDSATQNPASPSRPGLEGAPPPAAGGAAVLPPTVAERPAPVRGSAWRRQRLLAAALVGAMLLLAAGTAGLLVSPAWRNPSLQAPGGAQVLAGGPANARPLPAPLPGKFYVINSIGMRLVLVPNGKFIMGSPIEELSHGQDEEKHEVTITRPFYMGVYEVTQQQYQQVMNDNPSFFKGLEKTAPGRFPVENVSWEMARLFCEQLSDRAEEKKHGRIYRLPTEAEWEYACRAGGPFDAPFHFGNSLVPKQANFNGRSYGAPPGINRERTMPIGSFDPNAFGLYDMHGNVREWCQDWYGAYDLNQRTDPQGPLVPPNGLESHKRIQRGGSWSNSGTGCRAGGRSTNHPEMASPGNGFRVVFIPPAN